MSQRLGMSGRAEHLKDEGTRGQVILSGAIAGLVSRFCIAPLDVIKIRLQLQIYSLSDPLNRPAQQRRPHSGTLGTLKSILQHEGITGLWKGNIPAELLYITYGAVQFSAYRFMSGIFQSFPASYRLPDAAESFVSGAIAGGVATTVTYPLDLLRTRFAAQGTQKVYTGIAGSIRDITRHEGAKGFFQGLSAGVVQIIPYMGLFFSSYEALKMSFAELELPAGSGDALAGITASVFSKTAVYPLDTIRKRLQVQGPNRAKYLHGNIPLYSGVFGTLRTIAKREGIRGFYRGLPVSLLKAGPASAVTMFTYERAMKVLQVLEERKAV